MKKTREINEGNSGRSCRNADNAGENTWQLHWNGEKTNAMNGIFVETSCGEQEKVRDDMQRDWKGSR